MLCISSIYLIINAMAEDSVTNNIRLDNRYYKYDITDKLVTENTE